MPRELLGQARDFGGAIKTYRADACIEMDEIEGTHGTRRRIFFEDVLLVSYHRERTPGFLVGTGMAALLFMAIGIPAAVFDRGDSFVGIAMLIFGAPFLILFLLRLVLQVDVVTVFGQHGRARMEFEYRKARARSIHQQVCRDARAAQNRNRVQRPSEKRPETAPPAE